MNGKPMRGSVDLSLLRVFASLLFVSLVVCAASALDLSDIPIDAPQDELMASPAEIRQVLDWVDLAFTGTRRPGPEPAVRVELKRQDHSVLQFGRSCIETPIKLGSRQFQHGLGTHANSEIILHLPPDAKQFRSWVGIDNNFDTGGVRGSVRFSVDIGGREVFRSPILRGTNDPVEVKIDLPGGTTEITLKADTTPDGPAHDQADWADACIIGPDGHVYWADEDRLGLIAPGLPFSFRLGGAPAVLRNWQCTSRDSENHARLGKVLTWSDSASGLRVTAVATTFTRYAAVEWLLEFENTGTNDTSVMDALQALEVQVRSGYIRNPVRLHQLTGDVCGERSFFPIETEIEAGKPLSLAPNGGRSSNGSFPFFDLQYGNEGLITAIGWSGQWQCSIERTPTGPTWFRAGLEKLAVRLHPGEKIRLPRILLMPWQGDRLAAYNRFRRLLLFEYAPRQNGRPIPVPIALQAFDRYVNSQSNWGTETLQIKAANAAADMGCDTHWLDAAWFEGGFPNGVGNWYAPADRFPRGLKPISEVCHQRGLKFIVWFEPERVAAGSQVAREHPEFVFGGSKGGLFKLSDLQARRWLTDLLSRRIAEFGIDVYRNDFNLDPFEFWRGADAAGRDGLTEIRYVEGHYALWDDLLAKHPGLSIDNCSSGGRRIDLETLKRSVPLWHSDTGCSPGHADWNQSHISGLSRFVPLFGACAWTPTAYEVRSSATAGLMCQFAFLDKGFSFENARQALAEVKANQKFWYGDFYPLNPPALGPGALVAYQLHRSDLDSGIVLAFRRAECPYPALQTGLRAVKPDKTYLLDLIDESFAKAQRTIKGSELLSDFELRLSRRGTSLLLRYRPAE